MHTANTPIERNIFRAYDIRGIVGPELNESIFYRIGQAFAYELHSRTESTCFIGQDGRLSSDTLTKSLVQGLLDSGIDVIDLGQIPTPLLYFAAHTNTCTNGMMVTGSHNTAEYNGVKMMIAGDTLTEESIEKLYAHIVHHRTINGNGHYQSQHIEAPYINRILSDLSLKRSLRVVIDGGNGMSGPLAVNVLQQLGCTVIPLYCDIDGRFPNHHPDPTIAANLQDLKNAVLEHQADLGLAFDGDGDRLGVITNTGEIIWPDRLLMRYAQAVLQDNPNQVVVYDVKCSKHLATVIRNAGGIPWMCPTGHSIVKRTIKEQQALLAGEMSGHLFFKHRWYGFDDALYSACRLLEILSDSNDSVDAQFATIPNSISTPEIKIPVAETHKFSLINQFCEHTQFPNATHITIDGLRVEFENGWGLLRASNTSPCLVARFEADDAPTLLHIQEQFKKALWSLDKSLDLSTIKYL